MPPRHRIPTTDPLTRLRNEMDALGRPGMAGTARIDSGRGGGGRGLPRSVLRAPDVEAETSGAAQLLVMSCSAGSIAAGGDTVPFDSIEARSGGFVDVVAPFGGAWVHPISGTYSAVVKLEWETFTGGGTVRVVVNGVSIPGGLIVSGTAGTQAFGMVQYDAEAGSTGAIQVDHSSASAQTCDALVSVAITDPDEEVVSEPATPAVETFWYDSRNDAPQSTTVLALGEIYTIRITGNFNQATGASVTGGTPDAILYPSSGMGDGQATSDWDTRYAEWTGVTGIGHREVALLNLGSGATHVEPRGGSYATPTDGHVYLFDVVGEGSVLEVGPAESGTRTDNNGQFKVEIFEGTI